MLALTYDYATCVRNAEKVCWTIDEVMPPGTTLDFTRPFLPAALVGACSGTSLSAAELRKLNQIAGAAYVNLFAFVEEYIVATAVKHAHAEMFGDHDALRALCRFAEEELKHQQLFKRYLEAFQQSFGHECGMLGSAAVVAGVILAKSPMAVLMMTLHLELATQAHYTESVRDDRTLDPFFARLLKHHWLEEAQHAKIDALELDKLASDATPEQLRLAFDDYLDLIDALDELVGEQAAMDAVSLSRSIGRRLSEREREAVRVAQHAAYRRMFLVLGMSNRLFADLLQTLSPAGAARVAEKSAQIG